MPPASPPSDQQNTADDNAPLTDEDVGILYEIITHAEHESNVQAHPFRAIFTAYDTVLARHELDPDHDQIYLRFLLRLGGKRQPGETLYHSFESLLAELGIQIEINPEENEIQDVTRSLNATVDNSPNLRTQSEAGSDTGSRSRRASFHFVPDQNGRGRGNNERRSSSRVSLVDRPRQRVAQSRDRPSTRATTRPSERSGRRALSSHDTAQPARGRLTAREFAINLQHVQKRHASASVTRTYASTDQKDFGQQSRMQSARAETFHPHHNALSSSYDFSAIDHEDEQHEKPGGRPNHDALNHQHTYRPDVQELFYRPSETQLLRDADTFQHFRLRAMVRDVTARWHAVAVESKQQNERRAIIARNHDHGVLLRQSFDQWRTRLQLNEEAVAAERYFFQLEQKAGKARDLYLLTKAFTHWHQVVKEKLEHATEVRRQVLRLKYFHAWLTLTIDNNQKVRMHSQRKFFSVWKQRQLISLRNNQIASSTRAKSLATTGYWRWFWAFCERRAPQWKDRRLQSNFFNQWALASQQKAWEEYDVTVRRHQMDMKKRFSTWLQRTRVILLNSRAANELCLRKITAHSMVECRRQIRYVPLVRQVTNMADWRIAGSTFAIFVNRFRTAQQAHKVNQLRVMRNVWTAWNDCLRWQTLERQVDDRVLVQTLYRWVLTARCLLLQRLCEQRIKHLCLSKLLHCYRTRAVFQDSVSVSLGRKRQIRTSKHVLLRWRGTIDTYRQQAQIAFEFEAPRIAQQALSALSTKAEYIRKLDKWAVDADYYFCLTRYLKIWRAATAEVKRRKVHDAYAHVRRQNKMTLARGCLQVWRDRTHTVIGMQAKADVRNQNQLLGFGTSLFDRWLDRLSFLFNREDETTLEFDRRFAHRYLDVWLSRSRHFSQQNQVAHVYYEPRISDLTRKCLHKLGIRSIELKSTEGKGESLRRRYEKRHFQNFLRTWRQKTARKRGQAVQPPPFSSVRTARRFPVPSKNAPTGNDEHASGREEEWTAFDEGSFDAGEWIPRLEELEASSTPAPGYLSTPSNRAARARGMVRVSTTPMETPFATRLRSQLGETPSKRGRFGRSGRGFNGSTFGTIPESEPRTPGAA